MNKLQEATLALAKASDGNPVLSTLTVMLFWVMFNVLEALVETLIWGKPFEHWFDVVATSAFIAYSAYAVWYCAIWNSTKAPNAGKGAGGKHVRSNDLLGGGA